MADYVLLPDLPIRVTEWGDWLHGDELLHPRAHLLFEKHVVPAADGTYSIQIGFDRAPLVVDDTPYFVRSLAMYRTADGSALRKLDIVVSDDVQEELDPRTLMQSDKNVLYCRVMRHGFWVACRFPPHHYHALALHAEVDGRGGFFVFDDKRYDIGPYDPLPKPYEPALSPSGSTPER